MTNNARWEPRSSARARGEMGAARSGERGEGVGKEQAKIECNYNKLIQENTERRAERVKERRKAGRLR